MPGAEVRRRLDIDEQSTDSDYTLGMSTVFPIKCITHHLFRCVCSTYAGGILIAEEEAGDTDLRMVSHDLSRHQVSPRLLHQSDSKETTCHHYTRRAFRGSHLRGS